MKKLYLFIKKQVIDRFIANQSGSIIIAFAIMLPIIFICLAVSVNNASILRARSTVSEAANEASLVIVAVNNKNSSPNQTNDKFAANYISYYLTKKINNTNLNQPRVEHKVVQTTNGNTVTDTDAYYIIYSQDVDTLMKINTLRELGTSISVGNPLESGNTRKERVLAKDSTHIGFIIDTSGSISCLYNDPSCNSYTLVGGDTRLSYTSKILTELLSAPNVQDNTNIRYSFIPYDIGVPISSDKKNLAGGDAYQCSLLYKFNTINGFDFNKIDYNFWANKGIYYKRWKALKDEKVISNYITYNYQTKYKNTVYYYLDYYNYLYYSEIVGPSLNYDNDYALENSGLCVKTNFTESINLGATKYSCYKGQGGTNYYDDYVQNPANATKISQQYGPLVWLYDHMYSTTEFNNINYSFANIDTVDVFGTKSELFSNMDELTINFTRPIEPALHQFTPFMAMCQSPLYSNGVLKSNNDDITELKDAYLNASSAIKNFSTQKTPILQESKTADELLDYFNGNITSNITGEGVGGGTDTITALLRSVPILAKDDSKNKVMIIITDGNDDGYDLGRDGNGMAIGGAAALRDLFLTETSNGNQQIGSICDVIKEGLTSDSNYQNGYIQNVANRVSIHLVKIDPNADDVLSTSAPSDDDYRAVYGKWFDCLGNPKYLHSANNYESLHNAIVAIFEMETGVFIKNRN